MTLRSYLIIMIILTLICWGAWAYTLFTVDPDDTNWIGFLLFYASLFLSLVGTAAIVGFVFRFIIFRKELAFRLVSQAFRQAFLIALLIIVCLALLSRDLFSWLNLALLIIVLAVLETFLLSYRKIES